MSDFREEEALGKVYDSRLARRLFGYLRPYRTWVIIAGHDGFDVNHQPATFRLDLAIGPEGGWTPEEMTVFTQHNWTHVTLGPRILRAETAAIAAIAIASTHLA